MFNMSKLGLRRNNQTGWVRAFVLVIVIWSAPVAGSLAWYMRHEQQSILATATVAARANLNKDIGFRNWVASHGGVYVPPTEHTPANPYLKVPDRDVVTTTGKPLTLMNPAYALRQMQSDFSDNYGTKSHISSLKPLNPNNTPDAWEAKALQAFEQGSKEVLETQQIDGQPHLRMMLPFVVEQGCLKCHAHQGYQLGDIRGGISSAVPLAPFAALERETKNSLILSHGAIWLLGLAGLGVSLRRVERLEILARSTAAVEESERRFRAVAETANDAIISADSTGKVVDCNHSADLLFGYTTAEIIGQPLTMLMPERFRDSHSAGMARVVGGGAPHVIGKTVEFTGLRKDGSEFPLEISLAQWQASDGQFFTAIIRDITERKRAEESLRKLSQALEQSPSAIVITDLDANIEYVNEGFVKVTGYSRAELIGQNPRLLHSGKTPGETYKEMWACLKRGEVWKGEFINRRKDGSEYIELALVSPVRQADGRVAHYLAIKEDITERKRTEESLKNLAAKFHTMFELSTDAIMLLDEKGFFDCNPATLRIFGCTTRDDFISKHPAELSPPTQPGGEDSISLANQRIATAIKNGSNHFEWMHRRSNGTEFPTEVLLTALELNGKPVLQATVRDISARKQTESQLTEQLDELRRWYDATSGREARILELKHEVNELLGKSGLPPRYPSAESDV